MTIFIVFYNEKIDKNYNCILCIKKAYFCVHYKYKITKSKRCFNKLLQDYNYLVMRPLRMRSI